ncbi:MAG TPA: sigma-70 family RNA polymerase sigma factor [Chloroflexota bacterium]|nr:sigma-70 family RNA polymerase sigma factor [Chloroflexota bacterium]
MEEHRTIERLRRGDIGGLESLVRQYQVRAVRTAYLITRDSSLAQDVVQAAFVKAYERIDQFDLDRPFGPWFLRSVLHDAIKAAATRERLVSLEEAAEPEAEPVLRSFADRQPGPEAIWERAETADEVWAALRQLTPLQRAAVVARYFLGLSEAEMAHALDCAPSAVKWRLHAARERLRILLRPRND